MTRSLRPARRPDVRVTGGGSVFLFQLITPAAQTWVDENVSPDRQMFGCGLAVEHRFAVALAAGMQDDGLLLESGEVGP